MALLKLKKNKFMKREGGFTLVELIIVMAVVGIISSVVYNMISESSKQYRTLYASNMGRQEAQLSMDFIVSEIRRNDVKNMIAFNEDKNILKINRSNNSSINKDQLQIYYDNHEVSYQIDDYQSNTFSKGKRIKNLDYNVVYFNQESLQDFRTDIKSIEVVIDYYIDDQANETEQIKTLIILRSSNS